MHVTQLIRSKGKIQLSRTEKRNNEFLREQIHQMEIHKWIESEKAGKDLSDIALLDWINRFAAQFRREWEKKHGICNYSGEGR
jgi:superfamily I DNA and RNA helicase